MGLSSYLMTGGRGCLESESGVGELRRPSVYGKGGWNRARDEHGLDELVCGRGSKYNHHAVARWVWRVALALDPAGELVELDAASQMAARYQLAVTFSAMSVESQEGVVSVLLRVFSKPADSGALSSKEVEVS